MGKKSAKFFGIILLYIVAGEFGLSPIIQYDYEYYFSDRFGDINKGGIKGQNFDIKVDWGNYVHHHAGKGDPIKVKINDISEWDIKFLIPFFKKYQQKISGTIFNEQGAKRGNIEFKGDFKFTGMLPRPEQLEALKKAFSEEVVRYIHSRELINFDPNKQRGDKWNGHSVITLLPVTTMAGPQFAHLFKPFPEISYWVRNDVDQWTDTIYYKDYFSNNNKQIAYEVSDINLQEERVTQKVFFKDGRIARVVKYKSGNDPKASLKFPAPGKIEQFKFVVPATESVKIQTWEGEVLLDKSYPIYF